MKTVYTIWDETDIDFPTLVGTAGTEAVAVQAAVDRLRDHINHLPYHSLKVWVESINVPDYVKEGDESETGYLLDRGSTGASIKTWKVDVY